MIIKDRLLVDMKNAMRAKDKSRLESIRLLRAAIQRREIDERVELDDEGVQKVIKKMIKQSNKAIIQFNKGNRPDPSHRRAVLHQIAGRLRRRCHQDRASWRR